MKTTDRWVASADFHNRLWGSDRNHQHDTSQASGGSPDWWGCIWREWGRRASPLPAQSSLTGWGYLQHHHLWENDRLMLCNSDEIGQLVTRFQIKNHVKGLPVVRYLLIESCQVEFVLNVIFINLKTRQEFIRWTQMWHFTHGTHFTEELISTQSTEPGDPRYFFRAAHFSANN